MRNEDKYNGSGYIDPTPYQALKNIRRDRDRMASKVIKTIQSVAHLAGFEIVGRISIRDTETGEEYR